MGMRSSDFIGVIAALLGTLVCADKLPFDRHTKHISHGTRCQCALNAILSFPCARGLHLRPVHAIFLRALYDADCWAPDYCNSTNFYYRLCKLRLRGRGKSKESEYTCPEGEYCEELECGHKCWLPPQCWCTPEPDPDDHGPHPPANRMFCTSGKCFSHPSTQWGLCRKEPEDHELPDHEHPEEEEPVLPTGFHFYTQDELLYNAKLHIDEGHPYGRERIPTISAVPHHDEL